VVLEALDQVGDRGQPGPGRTKNAERGSQTLSIRYKKRLAEAGIETSVGRVKDSYDNALAETIIGRSKGQAPKHLGRDDPCVLRCGVRNARALEKLPSSPCSASDQQGPANAGTSRVT